MLRSFLKDETGAATIEFAVVFPFLMYLALTIFETGFVATRIVMLEHGLDVASRDLRLGADPSIDHEKLREMVCEHTGVLNDCSRNLILEVVELDLASAYPQNQPNCFDRTEEIEPTISFNPGGRNRIMFVRACMIVEPLFPGMGLTLGLEKDTYGGLQIVAYTAFMNEPA